MNDVLSQRPKRSARLLERDPAQVGTLLLHERQRRNAIIVADLIRRLRGLASWHDFYEFQRLLYSHVVDVEGALAEATRQAKRIGRGKAPTDASTDWLLEQAVLDRVLRQLRTVGDALAWRLFGYDRRVILAASTGEHPGPMSGKAGLDSEVAEVVHLWENEGVFALLHGLTNILRIADVTKFPPEGGSVMVEVKAKGASVPARQMARMQRAVDVVMNGAGLPGTGEEDYTLFTSSLQLRSKLRELEEPLRLAQSDGAASLRLGNQWVVTCVATPPDLDESEFESVLENALAMRARAFAKSGMNGVKHHLRSPIVDRANLQPGIAPPTIFPFDPETCALITCDYLSYESVLSWERLAGGFRRRRDAIVTCPLPEKANDLESRDPVLVLQEGQRGLTIHAGGLSQIHTELVPPELFVAASLEMLSAGISNGPGVFTFANERAVWSMGGRDPRPHH